MKEKIQEKINKKDWKIHELLKLKEVAETVAEELYHELDLNDQLEMVWEIQLDKTTTFGSLFKQLVTEKLEEQVSRSGNPDAIAVWDTDFDSWRSFRIESIIEFTAPQLLNG